MPRAWLAGTSCVKQAATTTLPTIVLDARDLVLRRGHEDTVLVGSAGSDGPRSPKARAVSSSIPPARWGRRLPGARSFPTWILPNVGYHVDLKNRMTVSLPCQATD
jgi:hypothetical protein